MHGLIFGPKLLGVYVDADPETFQNRPYISGEKTSCRSQCADSLLT